MSNFQHVSSEEEIAEVARLARRIWTEHYVPIIGQDQMDYMLDNFQSKQAIAEQIANSHEYYLVMNDHRPVAYIAIASSADDDRMMLSKFYLKKRARGHGLGRKMLTFVETLCRRRNITTVWLRVNKDNVDSIEWYRRHGFRRVSAPVKDIGNGFVMDDYIMEKQLNSS